MGLYYIHCVIDCRFYSAVCVMTFFSHISLILFRDLGEKYLSFFFLIGRYTNVKGLTLQKYIM